MTVLLNADCTWGQKAVLNLLIPDAAHINHVSIRGSETQVALKRVKLRIIGIWAR